MKENQRGSVHLIILALLVVILIGGVGYFVYKNHQDSSKSNASSSSTATSKSADATPAQASAIKLATFSDTEAGLTFKYPDTWTSKVDNSLKDSYGSFGGISGTLTSPSGNVLSWIYQEVGGKGDAGCTPNDGDVAFAAGNKCDSKQIISVEKIPSASKSPSEIGRNLFDDSLYITHTKYLSANSGSKVSYQICLDPYNDSEPAPTAETSMGFELPCEYWSTGFNVKFVVPNEAAFTSADAKTAETIMKTFKSI